MKQLGLYSLPDHSVAANVAPYAPLRLDADVVVPTGALLPSGEPPAPPLPARPHALRWAGPAWASAARRGTGSDTRTPQRAGSQARPRQGGGGRLSGGRHLAPVRTLGGPDAAERRRGRLASVAASFGRRARATPQAPPRSLASSLLAPGVRRPARRPPRRGTGACGPGREGRRATRPAGVALPRLACRSRYPWWFGRKSAFRASLKMMSNSR